jgi:hypothetical protein
VNTKYGVAEYFCVCRVFEFCCYYVFSLLYRVWKEDEEVDYIALPAFDQDQGDVGESV